MITVLSYSIPFTLDCVDLGSLGHLFLISGSSFSATIILMTKEEMDKYVQKSFTIYCISSFLFTHIKIMEMYVSIGKGANELNIRFLIHMQGKKFM